jgi:acetyl esterase
VPLDPLFANRLHFLSEPGAGWDSPGMAEFHKDTAEYVSPELSIEDREIPGPQGPIPVRIYTPKVIDAGRALVWFHGGAFQFGDINMNEAHIVSQEIAANTGTVVFNVDYRLVTADRKLPCCQIDGFAALEWVSANAARLGIDANHVFVGGASAGACLSGGVALLARDAGIPLAGVLPIYPIAHFVVPEFSHELQSKLDEIPDALIFSHEFTGQLNDFCVGDQKTLADNSYAFPADAKDLSGLPPFLIVNCEYDSLRASGEAYAQSLRVAGVDVTERLQLGAVHGHLNKIPAECVSQRQTIALMEDFLRSH